MRLWTEFKTLSRKDYEFMKDRMKLILIVLLIIFSNGVLFGQGLGGSRNPVKNPKNFEHIDCGFRYPFPGDYTLGTSIGYSPYKELGQGQINRFVSNLAVYDIGCIDLDDPPRKMKKDELISSLNSMTQAYLQDSFEFSALPTTSVIGKEIYEFKTKSDPQRRIKYIFAGNRVLIFLVSAYDVRGIEEALKLFNSVTYFSIRETTEKRMKTATRKSLPQTPALKATQTDAAHNNLKGRIKSVRLEAEDVPILVGKQERRIMSDETYDISGNLLKNFWFQDSGYPTSVRIYGFVGGARVSDSEEMEGGMDYGISAAGQDDIKLPPADERYEERYSYKYDDSKRLIERNEYDNRNKLAGVYRLTYKDDWMDEKWFTAEGKLNSTKHRQFDKNGNEIKYEFWWYEETDREEEKYDYKKSDRFGNWTERQVVKTITDRGLLRKRTSNEFRTITYY
jgi:hypothetical protein